MQIIARFPALPPASCDNRVEAAAEPLVSDPIVQDAPPRSPRKAWRAPAAVGPGRQVFPVRSVLVLAAMAVVAWSLALKNDAARRHAARLARAPAETIAR